MGFERTVDRVIVEQAPSIANEYRWGGGCLYYSNDQVGQRLYDIILQSDDVRGYINIQREEKRIVFHSFMDNIDPRLRNLFDQQHGEK